MNKIELPFGRPPNHYLKENATPQQLFEYVEEFYIKFAGSTNQYHVYGGQHDKIDLVLVGCVGNGQSKRYAIVFHPAGSLERAYVVYSNHVELVSPDPQTPEFQQIPQRTDGEHAWFITAHLRAAGVIRLQEQGLLRSSGH